MRNEYVYTIKQLVNLREQLDFAIDKEIEKVVDGEFDRDRFMVKMNCILFGHSLAQEELE